MDLSMANCYISVDVGGKCPHAVLEFLYMCQTWSFYKCLLFQLLVIVLYSINETKVFIFTRLDVNIWLEHGTFKINQLS
jgi:hypothetical protein